VKEVDIAELHGDAVKKKRMRRDVGSSSQGV